MASSNSTKPSPVAFAPNVVAFPLTPERAKEIRLLDELAETLGSRDGALEILTAVKQRAMERNQQSPE